MSDNRPNPKYGEYASPEAQRAASGQPEVDPVTNVPLASQGDPSLQPPAQYQTSGPYVPPRTHQLPGLPGEQYQGENRPKTGDRIVTIVLLAFGALSVILNSLSLLQWQSTLRNAMAAGGAPDSLLQAPLAAWPGWVAALVLLAGFALTVWWSLGRLRKNKLTFWVPLVGCVVTWIAVVIVVAIGIASDPTLLQFGEMIQSGQIKIPGT